MISLDSVPIRSTVWPSALPLPHLHFWNANRSVFPDPLFKTEVLYSHNWCWILKTKGKEKYHSGSLNIPYPVLLLHSESNECLDLCSAPTRICRKIKTEKNTFFQKKLHFLWKKTTLYTLFYCQLNYYITFYFYIFLFVKFLPEVLIILFIFQQKFIQPGLHSS